MSNEKGTRVSIPMVKISGTAIVRDKHGNIKGEMKFVDVDAVVNEKQLAKMRKEKDNATE